MAESIAPAVAPAIRRNPFLDSIDEFFGGGDRTRQLEELRHLSRWPRRLLAVTGERGVGKTTLYRALSNGLDPGVKAARINANLTSDTRAVLAGIIQGFGIASPANAQPQLLIELIRLHVAEQVDAKRYCLVLVDDAHLLELRALEQLLLLTDAGADEGLRIVFFAEVYFVQSLDKACKRASHVQSWHEIRLTPFTSEESRRYVGFRLAQIPGEERATFSATQLALIVDGSSGLPGSINALAGALLSGELTVGDENRKLPRMHRALALLVVVAVGMGWLIFSDLRDDVSTPAVDAADTTPQDPSEAGTAALAIPPQRVQRTADNPQQARPALVAEAQGAPKPVAVDAEAVKVPAARRTEAVPKPVSTKPAPAKPSPVKQPPANRSANQPQTAQWIAAQPGNRLTLQLFATSNSEQRAKFLRQQDHAERFATFESRRDGTIWYTVIYGTYANRADADAAAAALPASVARVKPWIRTFASVQAILK